MKQHETNINCKERVVALTTPKGERISVDVTVQAPLTAKVNQLNDDIDPQNLVVDEFPDDFLDELPGMPPTETLNLLLNYYLVLHP